MKNIESNEIHLYCLPLSQSIFPSNKLLCYLSHEENAKAESFFFSNDRYHYIQAHGILRLILSKYLQLSPDKVHIQVKENGKPFHHPYREKSIYFNISHTQNYLAFAFSPFVEIGVDIEYIKSFSCLDNVALQFFADEEVKYIFSKDIKDQNQAFYECWTRREAFLKSTGIGITNLEAWKKISFMKDIITYTDQKTSWKIENIWIEREICCAVSYDCTKSYHKIKIKSWKDLWSI